jgi:hypothetical protein
VTEVPNQTEPHDLLAILLERKVISPAQAELVKSDAEATGMLTEDIVLARRMIKMEALLELAPWLEKEALRQSKGEAQFKEYKANRKSYRALTNQILDENLD